MLGLRIEDKENFENTDDKRIKITFFSLLFETIVAIFMCGTASSEDKKEYNTKEKWKIWAQSIFNLNNFKNIFKKLFKGFAYFIVIFSIINLLIFTPIVVNQLKSPRYPVARAYLKSAYMVNLLYIFPLSKIFGYGNPLTWGFYPIKNTLYKIGISKLPKDEGEREIWWFNIRFVEYKTIVQPALMDSYKRDTTFKPLPPWQIKSLEKWHNELYSNILSWPSVKIFNSTYKKEKLIRFIDLAEAYVDSTSVLSTKLQVTEHNNSSGWRSYPDHLPYAKPEDVKNYMNIISLFEKLKAGSAKNDKESYDYFERNKRYYEDKFLYETAYELIGSEAQWEKLLCNSPEIDIFVTSNKNLRDFYVKNYNSLKSGEKGTIELLATLGMKLPDCNNIEVKKYKDFLKRKSDSFRRPMTMIEIFKDK